ncbi:MAG: DNA repair protein RecN, partial [Candidatus Omnitrophota bacterium]
QNYGLIDRVAIEFGRGLNVLTGETGAGKSILIGALRYALGERLHADQVRDAQSPCVVELVCELSRELAEESEALREYLGEDDQLIIHRTYAPDGKNKIRVNGFSLTLAQLKTIGDLLIDFHGPNDHQMLLAQQSHIRILDRLCGGLEPLRQTYAGLYEKFKATERALEEIRASSLSRERDLELLGHQLRELERVSLDSKKYAEILEKETQVKNHQKLFDSAAALTGLFENEENGIDERIGKAYPFARQLATVDKSTASLEEKINRLGELLKEIVRDLGRYQESLAFEPGQARQLAAQCDAYHDILRKYGPTIEAAGDFYKKSKDRRDFLINLEHNDKDLRVELSKTEKALTEAAAQMSKQRRKTALMLAKSVEAELQDLGIAQVRFECRISPVAPKSDGADDVTFYLSPNLGEALKPLAEIVSSGEAARVMLALKKSLTKVDPIPVLIFDEIDAQIGGRLGTVIGTKLCELAADRQVILVTHLPQIAGFAQRHFKVSKKTAAGRTMTSVDLLDRAARVKEMALMMGSDKTG